MQSRQFVTDAKRIGLTDHYLQLLEKDIMDDPLRAPVMSGTGGVRKIRVSLAGGGKSGGGRACYAWFVEYSIVYLIAAFAKNEKSNLTKSERNAIQNLLKGIKFQLERGRW